MMMTMNYFSIQFVNSCMQRSEGVRSSQIFVQFYSLHDYCEHLIAPGTLGHIAQKTLHLAATNCTTGEHHNTNFFPMHPPNPFRPGGPKNPGRVTLASRRPERQSPIRQGDYFGSCWIVGQVSEISVPGAENVKI